MVNLSMFYSIDLLKLEGIEINGQDKPKKKVNEEDLSDYAKISLEGGHKGSN